MNLVKKNVMKLIFLFHELFFAWTFFNFLAHFDQLDMLKTSQYILTQHYNRFRQRQTQVRLFKDQTTCAEGNALIQKVLDYFLSKAFIIIRQAQLAYVALLLSWRSLLYYIYYRSINMCPFLTLGLGGFGNFPSIDYY